ncbi:MAG: ATP-binding protein [Desulfobacterales bacterium]|nr:ATP-binding protein [Desulfobacterales bacterium]
MKNIMVVDNDRNFLKLMKRMLEKEGHQVAMAEDGLQALDLLKTYTPDIIFVDLIMPNIDGRSFCRIIRNIKNLDHAKIIILSGIASEERIDFGRWGVNACIAKGPFDETAKHILKVIHQLDISAKQILTEEMIGADMLYPRGVIEELLISKRHFENIVENMSEGVIEINADGRIVYANPSVFSLLNLPDHKLFGSSFIDLFLGNDRNRVDNLLKRKSNRTQKISEDAPLSLSEHLVTSEFLPFKEFGFTGIIIKDVTATKRIEEKLTMAKEEAEKANSSKSNFLANMSHEIRTPLNHIIGFTEMLADRKFGDINETQHEYLCDILESSKHLLSLVNDILDLSKLDAGKMKLEPKTIKLKELLENSFLVVQEMRLKHGIELLLDIKEAPETIYADDRKLKQILYNLLSNAIKFTPDGGKVNLTAKTIERTVRPGQRKDDAKDLKIVIEKRGDTGDKDRMTCVEISVSDTGIGVAPEDQERIFNYFEQVDGPLLHGSHGTGLGLALTKNLVKRHGGIIWVESEGKNKGSKFCFVIPV